MITSENESGTTPDDLAKLRADALHRQSNRSSSDNAWEGSFSRNDFDVSDSSLQLSRFLAIGALVIIAASIIWPAFFTALFFGWGILLLYCIHSIFQQERRRFVVQNNSQTAYQLPLPKSSTLWGLVVPLSMTASLCLVLARNAIDAATINKWVFLGTICTICSIYVANAINLSLSRPRFLAFLNGLTGGLSLSALFLFSTLMVATGARADWNIVLPTAALALVYSLALSRKLLLKVDAGISLSVFCAAMLGAFVSAAVTLTPELRGLAIALGEKLAVSADSRSVDFGYEILNNLHAAPELEILARNNNDQRPRSLAESFIPIDSAQARKLYFFVSGKTYKESAAPIDTYQNVAVADPNAKVSGLSMVESSITGHVDANSLTSVTYWTMVFGNSTAKVQEAQAKISLPPNSAVSRVTLWVNGKPQEAAFNSTERVTQAYQWITERHRDPLLITEPSRGVINLQAYPVPQYGEMKVRIGITSGLNARTKRDFTFIAPRIITSNFDVADAKTSISLESNAPITSNANEGKLSGAGSRFVYTGQIQPGIAHSYQFIAHRASDFGGFSARATHSLEDMIISEKLVKTSDNVGKMAIVIDASGAAASSRNQLKKALSSIPKRISARVFLADHRDDVESLSLDQAISRLDSVEYGGGVDDARALVAAKRFIGRDLHSSIVWIHGAQPVFYPADTELLQQLLVAGDHRLNIYDYKLDDQENQAKTELVSWSRAASPEFRSIEQGSSVAEDLTSFFNNVASNGSGYEVVREKLPNKHNSLTNYEFPVASRLSTIWAADEARRCAELGQVDTAVTLGTVYRVVTPVTGAVVMELQSDYEYQGLERNFYSVVGANTHAVKDSAGGAPPAAGAVAAGAAGAALADDAPFVTDKRIFAQPLPSAGPVARRAMFSRAQQAAPAPMPAGISGNAAPSLQGATNGTISPQMESEASTSDATVTDATVIDGVNTAGTVRVNNMANLEAALNLFACALQGVCALNGIIRLVQGFCMSTSKVDACRKLLLGATLLLLAVAIPGVLNWLIVPDANANLFS
ncbi:MAG: hypothetical protein EKK48_04770 [Candidatus Melainabacteria bacterium]|nr:MAG: hypothetical protein EKK48_04770 [Candidatus Melainabacteria bacterium]